jgi:hypothetical protein
MASTEAGSAEPNTVLTPDDTTGVQIAKRLYDEADQWAERRDRAQAEFDDLEDEIADTRDTIRDLNKKLLELEHPVPPIEPFGGKKAELRQTNIDTLRKTVEELRKTNASKKRQAIESRDRLQDYQRKIESARAQADEAAKRPGKPGTMQVGDVLIVEVLEALPGRPLRGERVVRPDGTISLGFYGDVPVVGLTRREIKIKIIQQLQKFLTEETLGLVAEDEDGKTIKIEPADSDRVMVDDSPTYEASRNSFGELEQRLINAVSRQLNQRRGAIGEGNTR